jgi:outer membrane biosynthesis protein TonB
MVTAAKNTPASPKSTASTVTKKPAAKKVVAETKTTAKTTPAPTVKKPAAKVAVAKDKKVVTTKTAKVEAKPEIKQTVKKESAPKTATVSVSSEHRNHMIATAAYFIAQRRGFSGGYEVQDWISAEIEIDKQLKS